MHYSALFHIPHSVINSRDLWRSYKKLIFSKPSGAWNPDLYVRKVGLKFGSFTFKN